MVAADAIRHGDEKTWRLLDIDREEGLLAVQLLGHDPASLAESAARLVETGADLIDLNLGCLAN